jgi:hypothetical protein
MGIFKAIKHGFSDGWNNETKYKRLYFPDEENDEIPDYTDEIVLLETIIQRRDEISVQLEKDLLHATPKQRLTILNKLNILDKQGFKDRQRLKQLKDLQRELE